MRLLTMLLRLLRGIATSVLRGFLARTSTANTTRISSSDSQTSQCLFVLEFTQTVGGSWYPNFIFVGTT